MGWGVHDLLSIRSSVHGYLNCFYTLAVVNNKSTNNLLGAWCQISHISGIIGMYGSFTLLLFILIGECLLIFFWERERERNIDVREKHWSVASCMRPNQGSNRNLDMCPDRESNPQTFGVQGDAPINWATQLGLFLIFWETSILFSIVAAPFYTQKGARI